jgi:hypothetical protein
VDDAVLAFWGNSVDELGEIAANLEVEQNGGAGYQRCDWTNGIHGSMDLNVFEGTETTWAERDVLILAYNKVYHGFFAMGGGKISYGIDVAFAGQPVLRKRRFVRINTAGMDYWVHLHFERRDNEVRVTRVESRDNADLRILRIVDSIEERLGQEEDASVQIG